MCEVRKTIFERLLNRLADGVYLYPRLFFYPQVLLFVACIYCTAFSTHHLEFSTSRDDLVGSDKKYHRNFLAFKKEFPGQDDIVAIVESDSMEKNRRFVERLGARLEAETNYFTDVFYKGDLKMMGTKALLFVPPEDLKELHGKLRDYRPFIQHFSDATNLASLFQHINTQIRTAKREDNAENRALIKALPALERIVTEAADSVTRPGTPASPGLTALFGGGPEAEREMYITFAQGKIYLATAHAKNEQIQGEAVEKFRELLGQTQTEVPGVNVGLTGEPVLEYDEMAQSQTDTTVATVLSLVLTVLIFIYGYQEASRPIKAALCLIVGLGYTMGYTTLAVGHLNILTITFAPMLIGLAIDFGVHLVSRYEEELLLGKSDREAMRLAMVNTGMGILTGALTTAGAFFAMAITDFKGIQEMGIIAGGGLVICLVPMMTLLPVLLLRGKRQALVAESAVVAARRERIEKLWLDRPGLVMGITVTICVLGVSQLHLRRVPFDYNLLHMQSAGLPAVVFEQKLIYSGSNSVLFGAVVATNLQQAVELEAQLTNLTTVSSVKSMSQFLAENPQPKLELIRAIKQEAGAIRFAPVDMGAVNVPELTLTLYASQGFFGAITEELQKEKDVDKETLQALQSLWNAIQDLRTRLLAGDREQNAAKIAAFQQALLEDLRGTFSALKNQDANGGLRTEDLPVALRNRFVGLNGKYLLQVFPKKDVWQRDNQREFVESIRHSLDPKQTNQPIITGTPVQLLEYTTLLVDSYLEAAGYSLAAIIILVLIHFRSLTCVVLALLPVGIGTLWMIGFMGLTGIPFNPANIMTLPLVIGIGVTNGIHILNRFAEEQRPSIFAKSTGKAVLVSGLTTIAGFGSLILAQHQGIASLGYVMAVGTATCMITGLTFLPTLLGWLTERGWKIKKPGGK